MARARRTPLPGGPAGATTFIVYTRVSTAQQGRSGLGLEAQQAAVQAYVARAGGRIVASGGAELADELEAEGYVKYTGAAEPAAAVG